MGRIGPWPGYGNVNAAFVASRHGVLAGNPSHDHARRVWEDSRDIVAAAAESAASVERMTDLAMVSTIADHLADCGRCWETGIYADDTPAEWLRWAVCQRRGMREVLEPVARATSGRAMATSWPRVGVEGKGKNS